MLCLSLIVFGSFLSWGASAKEGIIYPGWTVAHVADEITLSWSLPVSLKIAPYFLVNLKTCTSESLIIRVKKNNTYVNVEPTASNRVQYTGNISITGDGIFSFIVNNVEKEDAGKFICKEGTYQVDNCGQGLVVLQPPSTPNISVSNYKAVPGQPVTLTCTSVSKSLPPNHPLTLFYTWKRNDRYIQQTSGPELTLHNVTRHDTGAYSCQAIEGIEDKEIRSNWSRQVVLYGPEQVEFDPDSDTLTASEGQNINVTCSADCRPLCNVTWLDNSGRIVSHSLRKAVIKLTERKSEQSPYKCDVLNSFGRKSRNVSIHIPSSIRKCTSNTGAEHGTITIECTVYGKPQPDVSFILRGKTAVMELNNTLSDNIYNYSYVINNARCSDHGMHHVTANNNVESTDNYNLNLKVKCAPRMHENHDPIHLQRDKSHAFWSFVILAYPEPHSERLYFLPDDVRGKEVGNKLHCQQQTADNLLTCTAVYPGDETPDLGKYFVYFQHVEGDRIISLNLVDEEVATGPSPSSVHVIIPVAVVCAVLVLVLAGVVAVSVHHYKSKKELRRKRDAAYITPVRYSNRSDDSNYATINLEDVSVVTPEVRNDYNHLEDTSHHHIYTAVYPRVDENERNQRCSIICGVFVCSMYHR